MPYCSTWRHPHSRILRLLLLVCAATCWHVNAQWAAPEAYPTCDAMLSANSCTNAACYCYYDTAPVAPYGCISTFGYVRTPGPASWVGGGQFHKFCSDANQALAAYVCAAFVPAAGFCAVCGNNCCGGAGWNQCRDRCCGRCLTNPDLSLQPGESNICVNQRYDGNSVCFTNCIPGYKGPSGAYRCVATSWVSVPTTGESCSACPAGTWSGGNNSPTCQACDAGKYSAAIAATAESTCLACPPNTYSPSAAASSSAACVLCPSNSFAGTTSSTGASSCAPMRAFSIVSTRGGTLAVGVSSGLLGCAPLEAPLGSGVTLTITCTGAGSITTSSPLVLSFPADSISPQYWSYTAPPTLAVNPVVCSFTVGGHDLYHYFKPADQAIVLLPKSSIDLSRVPAFISVGGDSGDIDVVPLAGPLLPPAALSLTINCDSGVVVSASPLSFPAGSTAPVRFRFTAPSFPTTITCSYTVNGEDAAHYLPHPAPSLIRVEATSSFLFSREMPSQLVVNELTPRDVMGLTPVVPPFLQGLIMHINCSANSIVTGSPLTFAAGATNTQYFRLTAPTTPGILRCNFTLFGSDRAHYRTPASFQLPVVPLFSILVSPLPSALAVSENSGPIRVTPSVAPVWGGLQIMVHCDSGTFVAPSELQWMQGNNETATFSVTSPPFSVNVTCCFSLSGMDSMRYRVPNCSVIQFSPRSSFLVDAVPPALAINQRSRVMRVRPLEIPFVTSEQNTSAAVLLHVFCTAGVVEGSPLVFPSVGNDAGADRNWAVVAPSSFDAISNNRNPVLCSFSLTGPDAAHYSVPEVQAISITPMASFVFEVPSVLAVRSNVGPIPVLPSDAPFQQVGIQVHCSNGVHVLGERLVFDAGSLQPSWLNLSMPSTAGVVSCNFSLSGPDWEHFLLPSSISIVVVNQSAFDFSFGGTPPSVMGVSVPAERLAIFPQETPFLSGVSLSIWCSGAGFVLGSPLRFPAGSISPLFWSYVAPPTLAINPVTCSFAVEGSDAAHFATPNNISISLTAAQAISSDECTTATVTLFGDACSFGVLHAVGAMLPRAGGLVTLVGLGLQNVTTAYLAGHQLQWPAAPRAAAGIEEITLAMQTIRQLRLPLNSTSLQAVDVLMPALSLNASSFQLLELRVLLSVSPREMSIRYSSLIFFTTWQESCLSQLFWRADSSGNCLPCPAGARCPGGGRVWPLPGWWSPSEYVAPAACPLAESCLGYNDDIFTSAPRAEFSLGKISIAETASSSRKLFAASSQWVLADVANTCAEGFTNELCARCAQGYFMSHRRCLLCNDSDVVSEKARLVLVLLTAFCCLLLLSLCVAFFSPTSLSRLVSVFLLLQRVALSGQVAVEILPSNREEAATFFAWLSLVSMDLDITRAGCAGLPELTYPRKLLATCALMALTLVLFALACLLPLCVKLKRLLPSRQRAYMALMGIDAALSTVTDSASPSDSDDESLSEAWNHLFERLRQSSHIAAALFYLKLTSLSLQAFQVTLVPAADSGAGDKSDPTLLVPPSYVLTSDYQTEAYSAPHVAAMLLAVFLLATLTCGWPLCSTALLLRDFGHSRLRGVGGWLFRRIRWLRPTFRSEAEKDAHDRICQYIDARDGLLSPVNADLMALETENNQATPKLVKSTIAAVPGRRLSQVHAAACEYQSRLIASHGFLFLGVKPNCMLFTLQRFVIQSLQAAVAVFVTSSSLSMSGCNTRARLQLFLLGMQSALEALSLSVWLPHQSFRESATQASLRLSHVGYAALMLAIAQCDAQFSPALAAFCGFLLIFLLVRRRLPGCHTALANNQPELFVDEKQTDFEEENLKERRSLSKDTSPCRDNLPGCDHHSAETDETGDHYGGSHAVRILTLPGAACPDDVVPGDSTEPADPMVESPQPLASPSMVSPSQVAGIELTQIPSLSRHMHASPVFSTSPKTESPAEQLQSPAHMRSTSASSVALSPSELRRAKSKAKASAAAASASAADAAARSPAAYLQHLSVLAAQSTRMQNFSKKAPQTVRLPQLQLPARLSLIQNCGGGETASAAGAPILLHSSQSFASAPAVSVAGAPPPTLADQAVAPLS